MSYDPALSVRFSAFAVAQQAKINSLEPSSVDDLVTRAEQLLGSGDVLTRAITGFATQYQVARHQPDRLAELGRDLADFIDRLNVPVPPDHGRRDIHG